MFYFLWRMAGSILDTREKQWSRKGRDWENSNTGAWGMERKESAAELHVREVRKQQGNCEGGVGEEGRGQISNKDALFK